MVKPIRLETTRLILRTVTMEDLAAVSASWKLDEGPISSREAGEVISRLLADLELNLSGNFHHLCLAIIPRESPVIIGWCGVDNTDPARVNPVLFYLLKSAWRGQGLATEAMQEVLGYAFSTLGLPRLDSACEFENLASQRVMEKLGMRYLGLDAEGGHFFTLSREEFEQARSN